MKKQLFTLTMLGALALGLCGEHVTEARSRYYYDDEDYYYDRGSSTARGAVGGAATGALLGGVFGGGKGAAIGAGVGAGTGLIAGSARDSNKRYRYRRSMSTREENRALRKDIAALERENKQLRKRIIRLKEQLTPATPAATPAGIATVVEK